MAFGALFLVIRDFQLESKSTAKGPYGLTLPHMNLKVAVRLNKQNSAKYPNALSALNLK